MNLYENQFDKKHDFKRVDKPSKILIIASTPRCGSHMLGHALFKTESFGFPLEYTNPSNLAEWKRMLKINDFEELLKELQRRRTSENGVFGIKIHYSHIQQYGGFDKLLKILPDAYFVLLTRKNVLRQAVSLSLSLQTGVWISGQKPFKKEPKYNFSHINDCLRQSIIDNSSWKYLLEASGCNYRELFFEEIRNNLGKTILDLGAFMNINIDEDKISAEHQTKIQSNQINDEWLRLFRSDFDSSSNKLLQRNRFGF